MPPKSAKKDQKSLWVECDKCSVKIVSSKLKSHEKDCGNKTIGVLKKTFSTISVNSSLPQELDIKDAPATYLERFLFIPETICTLCDFTMGSNLLITAGEQKFVKMSWTISDKHLDELFCNSTGKTPSRLCLHDDTKFMIFRFPRKSHYFEIHGKRESRSTNRAELG